MIQATLHTHPPRVVSRDAAGFCLLLPDGVGVRNFVLGPFLREAERLGCAHALHGVPAALLPQYQAAAGERAQWHALRPYPDRPLSFVLRNCLAYAQMYWVDNYPMRLSRNRRVRGSWKTRAALAAARWLGQAAATPRRIQWVDRWHSSVAQRGPEVRHYRQLLRELRPGLLFCSHQRPTHILPPVLAARSLGIPTATFIFSWDNITTKGRIAAPFDHFLVWSDHMRQELLRYYPDVSAERVHVVGTPQFDPYADEDLHWSRAEFCRRVGADPWRPLICYSGGDVGNCPADPAHLAVLMEHIRTGRIGGRPQVLLRPCPVDDGRRFAEIRRRYPDLLTAQPAWVHDGAGHWDRVMPSAEDVQFLANVTRHADLNINFGSTMTLDFALRDKPVINLAFDVTDPPTYGLPMWEYLQQFEHYRPVIEFGAARFARTADELAGHVNAYLQDPSLDREGRRRFAELEVGVPVGQSSRRIVDVLQQIAR